MNNGEQHMEERKEQQPMPSSREIMECKRVFNRKHIPTPDTEEEWQRFCRKRQYRGKTVGSPNKWNLIVGFVSGIAATIVLLWMMSPHLDDSKPLEPVRVFNAVDNANDVILTSETGETYIISGQAADSVLLAKGVNANRDSLVYGCSAKVAEPKWVTLTTPRGKDYKVTLPDGSKVWLNADSKLVFPEQFTGDKRLVTLHGEAYFNVARDEKHPFEVKNDFFITSVLGTEFNVRAYAEADAHLVLVRGKVGLCSKVHPEMRLVSPGQKAQWKKDGEFVIDEVDTYAYVQWKEGYFYFNNVPLVEVMKELGRWYNVDIVFENTKQMNTRLHFVADRNQDLMFALSNLNTLEFVHATIKENKIIVK